MNSISLALVEKVLLAPEYESKAYVEEYVSLHMRRFFETIAVLRRVARPTMRVIDIGSYGILVAALRDILGLADITITGPQTKDARKQECATLANARRGSDYTFRQDAFDLEEPFPYEDETFDLVLFTEVLEHIPHDPLQTLSEINRITKQDGWMMLTTPNCASARSIVKIMQGRNPNIYPIYTKQPSHDRHNREYAPSEIKEVLRCCGYRVELCKTVDVYSGGWDAGILAAVNAALAIGSLLTLGRIKARGRGDTIFALGRKVSGVTERYPSFLYE